MAHRFAGIYTPIVTPFTASGDLDERGMLANVDRYLASPFFHGRGGPGLDIKASGETP